MNETPVVVPTLPKKAKRGFLSPDKVRASSFFTITICVVISVLSCILAIWDFTKDDTLWRTVATCVVIGGGMMAFGLINVFYGEKEA